MFRNLIFITCILFATPLHAQDIDYGTPSAPHFTNLNGITLNFPTYLKYAEFGGWSIGAEYRRLLNAKGTLGTSLSYTRLIWAGTAEAGKYYAKGVRANIKAHLFAPGFNYYPFGSDDEASVEIGVLAQIGSVRRVDTYSDNGSSIRDTVSNAFFFAPQLHAGVSILGKGHFLLTFYGEWGPMLACDKQATGNYLMIGAKIGRRF